MLYIVYNKNKHILQELLDSIVRYTSLNIYNGEKDYKYKDYITITHNSSDICDDKWFFSIKAVIEVNKHQNTVEKIEWGKQYFDDFTGCSCQIKTDKHSFIGEFNTLRTKHHLVVFDSTGRKLCIHNKKYTYYLKADDMNETDNDMEKEI